MHRPAQQYAGRCMKGRSAGIPVLRLDSHSMKVGAHAGRSQPKSGASRPHVAPISSKTTLTQPNSSKSEGDRPARGPRVIERDPRPAELLKIRQNRAEVPTILVSHGRADEDVCTGRTSCIACLRHLCVRESMEYNLKPALRQRCLPTPPRPPLTTPASPRVRAVQVPKAVRSQHWRFVGIVGGRGKRLANCARQRTRRMGGQPGCSTTPR